MGRVGKKDLPAARFDENAFPRKRKFWAGL